MASGYGGDGTVRMACTLFSMPGSLKAHSASSYYSIANFRVQIFTPSLPAPLPFPKANQS